MNEQVFPVKSHNMNDSCNLVTIEDGDDMLFNQLQKLSSKQNGQGILDQKVTDRETTLKNAVASDRKHEKLAKPSKISEKKIMLINNDQNELDQIQFFFNMLGLDNAEERVTLCKSG